MNTTQTLATFKKRRIAEASPEKLVRDVRVLLHDAEELLKATAGDIEERTRETRAKLAGALVVTRETCNQLEEQLTKRVHAVNAMIRERPFGVIAAAFGMGMVLGILLDGVLVRRVCTLVASSRHQEPGFEIDA
jgi:ElaB/YqjD/DUF883 family membrane-anchored ribosome-binding protein